MFGFLKDKLKEAIGKFTKKADEEAEIEESKTVLEEKKTKSEEKKPEFKDEKKPEIKEEKKEPEKKKEEHKKETKEEKKHERKEHKEEHGIKEHKSHKKEDKEKKEHLKHSEEIEPDIQAPVEPEEEPLALPVDKVEEKVDLEFEPDARPFKIPEREPDIEPIKEEIKVLEKEEIPDYIEEDVIEEKVEEKPKKKGFFDFLKRKEDKKEEKKEVAKEPREEPKEELTEEEEDKEEKGDREEKAAETPFIEKEPEKEQEEEEELKEEKEEKKGFFSKITESITKVSLSEKKFDEIFWELELGLLENNVAIEVIDKIKEDLKKELVEGKFARKELDTKIMSALRKSILSLFDVPKLDLIEKARSKKPFVIVFIGINGTGKTTTLAKITHLFLKSNLKPVMGACDTFRAAAIQQLEEHATNLNVKIIKHNYGSDPAAVAFDTIEHAKAHGKDVVLIDTAGRLHSNKNLMQELEKVIKIAKPDLKIFIGESLAGNDVVEQVRLFNDSVGIDGIILSKADTDEKGGAAISVSYMTKKPILFLGTGQTYDDLEEFSAEKLVKQLGL